MKRLFTILALCVAVATVRAAEAPLTVSNWNCVRMRKTADASNVVESSFKLTNRAASELTDVTVEISYQDVEAKELKATEPVKFERLAVGETKDVMIQTAWAPSFDTYEIRVSYRDAQGLRRAQWFGQGMEGRPVFIPSEPLAGNAKLQILGQAVWSDKPGQPLSGIVRMRNLSASAIERLTANIVFFDKQGRGAKSVGNWSGAMGNGLLSGGEEKIFKFTVNRVPKSYGDYRLEFTYSPVEKAEEFSRWSGGDFSTQPVVEAVQWDWQRSKSQPDVVAFAAKIHNGTNESLESATLTIKFLKNDGGTTRTVRQVEIECLEEIPAGQTQTVETVLRNFKSAFDSIERELSYRPKAKK